MQAVDTNVLIYAEITASQYHRRAIELLTELAQGIRPWAIPWPCLYEFLRVVTHPRVYHPPMPIDVALTDLRAIVTSPSLTLLCETIQHFEVMEVIIRQSMVTGNLIHDAHIAALCIEHGVSEFLTGDRDFARFSGLRISNPFE